MSPGDNKSGARSCIASLIIVGTSLDAVKARQVNAVVLAFCHAHWLLMSPIDNTPVTRE